MLHGQYRAQPNQPIVNGALYSFLFLYFDDLQVLEIGNVLKLGESKFGGERKRLLCRPAAHRPVVHEDRERQTFLEANSPLAKSRNLFLILSIKHGDR